MICESDHFILSNVMGDEVCSQANLSQDYFYIVNRDGTIRWLFPKTLRKPTFLSFYSTSSPRAKIFSALMDLVFLLRIPRIVSGGILSLQISKGSRLARVLDMHPGCNFSIFTGTNGENRKVIVEINNGISTCSFVKIGVTEQSKKLVEQEKKQLCHLSLLEFDSLVVPQILDASQIGVVGLENIKPAKAKQGSCIMHVHIAALDELYQRTCKLMHWIGLESLKGSVENRVLLCCVQSDSNNLNSDRVNSLMNKVLLLGDEIRNDSASVPVSMAHCDFTPWNMYVADNSLFLFDWELSQMDMPMLVDLFHFVFQSEVMIGHSDYRATYSELVKMTKMVEFQKIIETYGIDVNKHYKFYLVYTIAYYLPRYSKQGNLHVQAYRLFSVWEDAVNDLLAKDGHVFSE